MSDSTLQLSWSKSFWVKALGITASSPESSEKKGRALFATRVDANLECRV